MLRHYDLIYIQLNESLVSAPPYSVHGYFKGSEKLGDVEYIVVKDVVGDSSNKDIYVPQRLIQQIVVSRKRDGDY